MSVELKNKQNKVLNSVLHLVANLCIIIQVLIFFLFIEGHPDASKQAEAIKKARVGYINLKAYLNQVDCIEFATALRNEFLFAVGSAEGFGPWLDQAEERIKVKPVMVFS